MNDVVKDHKGEALVSVKFKGIVYSHIDVAYTLSQVYQKVTIGDNVFVGESFPNGRMIVETNQIQPTFTAAGFYFDADGIFMFHGDSDPNPDRAAEEFIKLGEKGKIILGPTLTKFNARADAILHRSTLGGNCTIYIYNES